MKENERQMKENERKWGVFRCLGFKCLDAHTHSTQQHTQTHTQTHTQGTGLHKAWLALGLAWVGSGLSRSWPKACCPVSSSSVGHVRTRRPVFRWVWITNFKRQRKSTSRLRKWANQDSSGTTKKRAKSRWLSNRDSKTQEKSKNWMKLSSQRGKNVVSNIDDQQLPRWGTPSWNKIWTSWEKFQWDGSIEAISAFHVRYNFKEKIDRWSRHYPWTHR